MEGAFTSLRAGWTSALTSVLKEFEIEKRTEGAFDAADTLFCRSKVLTHRPLVTHSPLHVHVLHTCFLLIVA